jgi:hypothetical protein
MPLFRRSNRPGSAEPEEQVSPAMEALGELPCTQQGCTATTGIECEYVDRRMRRCRTAWCPLHRVVVHHHVYCRRHAGVVAAVPTDLLNSRSPLPDLENRAPSLVNWVANEVDGQVRRLLLQELDATGGGELVCDPTTLVFVGIDRRRGWERAWKLIGRDASVGRVSLLVEEDADTEVAVKVGFNVVDRLVPPWIAQRGDASGSTPADDRRARDRFNECILDAIDRGLARERELAQAAGHASILTTPRPDSRRV